MRAEQTPLPWSAHSELYRSSRLVPAMFVSNPSDRTELYATVVVHMENPDVCA